jgi:outer membrane protein assembly factor BamD
MLRKFTNFTVVLLIFLIILFGCGKSIKRETLDADAYYAYAKDLFDRGKHYDAITEFTIIVLKFSGNPIVDDAQFYLAESYYENGEYLIAVAEYQKLLDDYPQSPYVEQSFYKIGLSYYRLSQRAELDQEYTNKSLRHFQNLIEAYPDGVYRTQADKKLVELRTKLAKKQLIGGNVYRKMGIYDSAIIYYDILLEKYYDTPPAEKALYWKSECQYKLKLYNEAITNFTAFLEKYPKSRYVVKAKSRITSIQNSLNPKN